MATPASSVDFRPWLLIDGTVIEWDDGRLPVHETTVLEEWVNGAYRECLIEPLDDAPVQIEVRMEGAPLPVRQSTWLWQPEGSAGLYRLTARDLDTGTTRQGWVRVLPTTVSHMHYQVMLRQIQETAYHLIFQSTSSAHEAVSFSEGGGNRGGMSVGLIEYHKLAKLLPVLGKTLNDLHRNPRDILAVRSERVPAGSASQFQLEPPFEDVSPHNSVPREVTAQISVPSFDVYENQLVRHLVCGHLPTKLQQVSTQLEHEIRQRDVSRAMAEQHAARANAAHAGGWLNTAEKESARVRELNALHETVAIWQRSVRRWGRLPFIQGASPLRQRPQPTPTLLCEPRYRRFYKLFLDFQRDLRLIDLSGLASLLHTRQQWQLYEMWVVLTLTQLFRSQLLDNGYRQVGTTGLYRVKSNSFEIDIDRSRVLEFQKGKMRVRIAYERLYESFKKVDRAQDMLGTKTNSPLTPDLAIEIYRHDAAPHLLLLDAKYKHNDGYSLQADIDKVHNSYVHLIGLANPAGGKALDVDARAIVVFPGSVPNLSPDAEAGALPLVPGGLDEQLQAYATLFQGWLAAGET